MVSCDVCDSEHELFSVLLRHTLVQIVFVTLRRTYPEDLTIFSFFEVIKNDIHSVCEWPWELDVRPHSSNVL